MVEIYRVVNLELKWSRVHGKWSLNRAEKRQILFDAAHSGPPLGS